MVRYQPVQPLINSHECSLAIFFDWHLLYSVVAVDVVSLLLFVDRILFYLEERESQKVPLEDGQECN